MVNSIINTNVLSEAVEELQFIEEQGIQQQIFVELSPDEQKIIDLLTEKELPIDLIVESLDWGFSKVANELLQAEFKGLIISLPGKIYKKNI